MRLVRSKSRNVISGGLTREGCSFKIVGKYLPIIDTESHEVDLFGLQFLVMDKLILLFEVICKFCPR